jgi:hypothetical protein
MGSEDGIYIVSDSDTFFDPELDKASDESNNNEFVPGTQVIFVRQDESHVRQKLVFTIRTKLILQNGFNHSTSAWTKQA